jgi:hypothetical protein
MPLVAYSIASALVAECEHGRHTGDRMIDKASGDVDDVAGSPLQHLGRDPLRDIEEAGEVGRDLCVEILGRVVGERLGDEDAGIVDQRVDPAEARVCLFDNALCRRRIADISGHGKDVGITALLDGARRCHDPVVAVAEGLDQAGADTLGSAGDDGDFAFVVHGLPQ